MTGRGPTRTHLQRGPPLKQDRGAVYGVAFSPDGRTLTTAYADGTVQVWDAGTHVPVDQRRLQAVVHHRCIATTALGTVWRLD
jgi:WD40 repeat protein